MRGGWCGSRAGQWDLSKRAGKRALPAPLEVHVKAIAILYGEVEGQVKGRGEGQVRGQVRGPAERHVMAEANYIGLAISGKALTKRAALGIASS